MTQHKKQSEPFAKFKAALKLPHYQAVGIRVCLEHLTVGGRTVTPESLAAAMEWDGSPMSLYAACVDCGWLVVVNRNN